MTIWEMYCQANNIDVTNKTLKKIYMSGYSKGYIHSNEDNNNEILELQIKVDKMHSFMANFTCYKYIDGIFDIQLQAEDLLKELGWN